MLARARAPWLLPIVVSPHHWQINGWKLRTGGHTELLAGENIAGFCRSLRCRAASEGENDWLSKKKPKQNRTLSLSLLSQVLHQSCEVMLCSLKYRRCCCHDAANTQICICCASDSSNLASPKEERQTWWWMWQKSTYSSQHNRVWSQRWHIITWNLSAVPSVIWGFEFDTGKNLRQLVCLRGKTLCINEAHWLCQLCLIYKIQGLKITSYKWVHVKYSPFSSFVIAQEIACSHIYITI